LGTLNALSHYVQDGVGKYMDSKNYSTFSKTQIDQP
jgi:hypothetical protein